MFRIIVVTVVVLSLLFLFGCGIELDVSAPADVEIKSVKVTADEIRLNFIPNRSGTIKFTIPHNYVSDSVNITSDLVLNIPVIAGEEYDIKMEHDKQKGNWGKCIVVWEN